MKWTTSLCEAGGSSWKRRVGAGLLLIFCCWHAGFLIFSIMPQDPKSEVPASPAMDFYRLVAGGRQEWNMVETIPVLHSLDARLEVEDEKGNNTTGGCVLPGWTPYPEPELARYYVLFHRMLMTASKPSFLEAYLRRVEGRLAAQRGKEVSGRWSLVIDAEYTRTLSLSRRDGELYVFATRSFNPANPGGIAP